MSEIQVIVHKPERNPESLEKLASLKQSECAICFSNVEGELTLKDCQHSFCKDCLQEYLKTEISSMNVLKIKCPDQTCPCILNSSSLEELLDSSDFERYQKLFLQKTAKRTQDIICPQPGCSKIILPVKDSTSTKCGCGSIICNLCGSLEHQGKSCIAAVDPEFEAYAAANNLKMCLMCKTVISRVEGCLHITCSVCDYDWCWLCGREYNDLHEAKCPRTWSPLPPRYIVTKDIPTPIWKKIVVFFWTITQYIIYALVLQTVFPYILFNLHIELRLPSRTRREKCQLVSLAIFLHVLYLFFVCLITYLLIQYPQNRTALTFCLCVSLSTPWTAKLMIFFMQGGHNKKRWKSRNAKVFHYTPAHKPKDLESSQANAQV